LKICSYMLINIQSWDKTTQHVDLSDTNVNVIIAPSETGKSVIVKILKEMCFPGHWGYTSQSLIRRGCNNGTAVFFLGDGSKAVTFTIERSYITYQILTENKEDDRIWKLNYNNSAEIPEEVAMLMGLVIDRKARTVINVLDKDMPVPFVNADQELNARIASVITKIPELEKRREYLDQLKERLSNAEKILKKRKIVVEQNYKEAPIIDINNILYKRKRAQELDVVLKCSQTIINSFSNDLYTEPKEVIFNDIKSLLNLINIISSMLVDMSRTISSIYEPETINYNNEVEVCIENILSFNESIKGMLSIYDDMIDTDVPCFTVEPDKQVTLIFNFNNEIKIMADNAVQLIKSKKPNEVILDESIEDIINTCKIIESLNYNEIFECYKSAESIDNKLSSIEDELNELKNKIKICPVCKKPL